MAVGYNPSIVSDGLVFFLDAANTRSYSGSGVTANGLVGGIGGTLVNGVGFTSSDNGYFSFDGTNDYMDCGYNALINNATQWTFECWYKSSSINTEGMLFSTFTNTPSNLGYHIEIFQSKLMLQIWPASTYTQSTITLSNNIWYQLIVTYNSGLVSYYVKGESAGTASYTFTSSSANLLIGKWPTNNYYLNGQLASVRFYNRALTQQEILQNFNATRFRYGI
jgi:hypothetical protein